MIRTISFMGDGQREMPGHGIHSQERGKIPQCEGLIGADEKSENGGDSIVPSVSGGGGEELVRMEGEGGGVAYGHASVMGRRRVMEDALAVVAPMGVMAGKFSFFGVYDGHGGAVAAETCSRRLHNCLREHIEKWVERGMEIKWEKVMEECFGSVDDEIAADWSGDESGQCTIGSTAAVVLVGAEELVVANCGDSRVVLCRGGVAVPLSRDHKPDGPDEKARIEAAGGMIINRNSWRVQGVLPTSRSLGDHHLKPYVTCVPEVTVTRRTELDEFLIIATDGLWGVVCNEAACEIVTKCLNAETGQNPTSVAAVRLAEVAIAKGSNDNITTIVVRLK